MALDTSPDAPEIVATRRWLEQVVIGLNLCPFARAPHLKGRVRFVVSPASNEDELVADLADELGRLAACDIDETETTLLIHPQVLGDFLDFNDFLDIADATVQALGLEGELQVASFHPDYQFGDAAPDAVENCTNRSPYPTLHLLREASIEARWTRWRTPTRSTSAISKPCGASAGKAGNACAAASSLRGRNSRLTLLAMIAKALTWPP